MEQLGRLIRSSPSVGVTFGGATNGSQEDYPCIRMAQEGAPGVMSSLLMGYHLWTGVEP